MACALGNKTCQQYRAAGGVLDDLAAAGLVTIRDGAWWRASGTEDQDGLVSACRSVVVTYSHHGGTCRLGVPDDARSVVGPDLSVPGTTNLAVADSSILPQIPRANTNLISMAIGYRAPDLVT